MNKTITITLDLDTTSPETLAAVVSLLKGEQVAAPAVPEGPKRTAKAAAVKEPEKAPAQEAAPAVTQAPPAPETGKQAERIPIEKMLQVMAPYATGQIQGGKEILREALEHFGATRLTELPEEKYQECLDYLDYLDNLSTKKTAV